MGANNLQNSAEADVTLLLLEDFNYSTDLFHQIFDSVKLKINGSTIMKKSKFGISLYPHD